MNKFSCFNLNFLLLTFYFLLPPFLAAQTPEWVYQHESPYPNAIAVDSAGNTYTTGCIARNDTGGVGIIALYPVGVLKWLYFRDFGSGGTGEIGKDIVFKFNRIYLTGGTGMNQLVVVSIDTSGQELWLYGDTLAAEGRAISISFSQNLYVAGIKYPSPPDWVVIKLNSLGNEVWRYVYDGPAGSYDEAADIAIDRNENIYVGGYSTGIGTNTDFTVIKLNSAGNEKWVYRYNGPANLRDEIETIALDTSGNVYMTGWSSGFDWDICVIKIDSAGNEQWVYRHNGSADWSDRSYDLAIDDTMNVYVCGGSYEDTIPLLTVIKLDSDGNEQWCYLSAGPSGRGGGAGCIALDGFGGVYAGGGYRNASGRRQIALVKLDTAGNELWTYIHPHIPPSSNYDNTSDIVVDIAGNIYVCGKIAVLSFNDDIVVMKFAAPVSTREEMYNNLRINIVVSILRGGIELFPRKDGNLEIYDVLGRLVVRQTLCKGSKYFCPLSTGVYFVKLTSEGKTAGRKVIIL